MAIALVTHIDGSSTTTNGFTTGAIDTTGATLLVAAISEYSGGTEGVFSDSKGNTWTQIGTTNTSATNLEHRLFYSIPTSVGAGHTFAITGLATGNYPALAIAAFSGTHASAPLDQQITTAFTNGTLTVKPGSITPSQDNEVVVTAFTSSDTYDHIDAPFTPALDSEPATGNNQAVGLAYNIQTTATAADPTWTWAGAANKSASIASFKVAAAGGETITVDKWHPPQAQLARRRIGMVPSGTIGIKA